MNYWKSPLVCLILATLALPASAHRQPSCRNFPETGHQVCGRLLTFWNQNGGLPVFGYPTDGKTYLTQWFERARFEAHPEHAGTPYEVLLGLLSTEQAGAASAPAPAVPDLLAQVIDRANAARAAAGCPALVPNDALMQIAQAHSQDMAIHDFFEHDGSDGRRISERGKVFEATSAE